MKSFMTMFATANARRMRIGLVGLAAMAIATIIGTSLASAPLFSVRLPQASPAVSANSYAPLDQHERHAPMIDQVQLSLDQHERHAAASIDAKARATGFYYTTQNVVSANSYAPLDQHERHAAASIDAKARATGFYYTTQNAVAAPAPAATSIDEQARATGYYYTTQIMDR